MTWQIENVPRRIGMAFTDEPIPMPALSIPHVSPALARSAREHFQCLYARPLSDDDGLEMATNALGAFAVLLEWHIEDAAKGPSPAPPIRTFQKKRRSPATSVPSLKE